MGDDFQSRVHASSKISINGEIYFTRSYCPSRRGESGTLAWLIRSLADILSLCLLSLLSIYSVQRRYILKNGIHNISLFLIAGCYSCIIIRFIYAKNAPVLIQKLAASNVERLRDFIKHVYVDRRFTGERSQDKSPRTKMVMPLALGL